MDHSLFDEAARDYESEAAERRTALVRTAVSREILPFLSMAASPAEYEHRRALAADTLYRIAENCDAPLSDVVAMADRLFTLFYQRKANLETQRKVALEAQAAGMKCTNCDHVNPPHQQGGMCSACDCTNYTPKTAAKEGRRVTAEEGSGPFS